ncbi:MAG: transposase [Bryobacteraceae bacterium]
MARRPRVVVCGVAQHVTQRGNDRQAVFYSTSDRHLYLKLLSEHASRYSTRILGYCLMTNHVHLIAVPDCQNSLALTMGRTHCEYALAQNKALARSGHVWQNRFFSCHLEQTHLIRALRYVEMNPVRAGLAAAPWDWPWSSARAHSEAEVQDPILDPGWVEYFGNWNYGEWREMLGVGVSDSECDLFRKATRTGEPLGSPAFVEALERQVGRKLSVQPRGRPKIKCV